MICNEFCRKYYKEIKYFCYLQLRIIASLSLRYLEIIFVTCSCGPEGRPLDKIDSRFKRVLVLFQLWVSESWQTSFRHIRIPVISAIWQPRYWDSLPALLTIVELQLSLQIDKSPILCTLIKWKYWQHKYLSTQEFSWTKNDWLYMNLQGGVLFICSYVRLPYKTLLPCLQLLSRTESRPLWYKTSCPPIHHDPTRAR